MHDWFARELEGLLMDVYAFPRAAATVTTGIDILRDAGVKHILLVDHQMLKGESDVYPRLPITAFDADEAKLRAAGLFAMGTRRGETRSPRRSRSEAVAHGARDRRRQLEPGRRVVELAPRSEHDAAERPLEPEDAVLRRLGRNHAEVVPPSPARLEVEQGGR